jgi:hypothetical protein
MLPVVSAILAALSLHVTPQAPATPASAPAAAPPVVASRATRAARAPVIDGRDDEDVWREAAPITDFHEWDPREAGEPRYRTVAKVAYDDRNLYVFVRAFDPEPGTMRRVLTRRDDFPPTDHLFVILDPYHDHRTGFEFGVSPDGGKWDASVSNDGDEDGSWDGVWDVATTVDSLGWTAEFRFPLSQMRYANTPTHTFGLAIGRDINRFKERLAWPIFRRTRAGLTSQLGHLEGIDGIASPRRLEVLPYVVTKNVSTATPTGFGRAERYAAGADVKYGVTSNLTLDATVNPDFGQVEADPAVLNLSAFETFYEEKRPFFIEGNSQLRFSVNCTQVNCGSEGLYYSRRIGRAPQLGGRYGDANSPQATRILGAAKLTGRLAGGLSIGILDAVTQRQRGTEERTIEPAASYTLVRASQDLRGGETSVGLIGTAVNRANDAWTRDGLRSRALVGGIQLRHRFLNRRYQLQAAVTSSRVTGSADAIAATQRSSVHYYQRSDAGLPFDTTLTALSGNTQQIRFGKVGGGILRFETSYQRISAGYEINDLGYLQRADWQNQATWVGLSFYKPTRFYRSFRINFNEWNDWTASGLPLGHYVNSNLHTELPNKWSLHLSARYSGVGGPTYSDRASRGGPAVRRSPAVSVQGGIEGDSRRAVSPSLYVFRTNVAEEQGTYLDVSPSVTVRVASRWSTSAGVNVSRNRDDWQWYGNFTDARGTTHYTFAHLWQQTAGLQLRVDYTASPTLTLQAYAEPFVTRGTYSNIRELSANPRAVEYTNRFRPYGDTAVANHPGGFNFKQFRSNVVMRWEYAPGSTVYLVWTQGRQDSGPDGGPTAYGSDIRDLFRTRPDNTFLVKVTHWFDW